MIPFLVQRAEKKHRPERKGIDSIIKFSYMGSSDFEWGALPNSLGVIRKNINTYTYLDVPIEGKVVTVFCPEDKKSLMETYLKELGECKHHLKEGSYFDSYLFGRDNVDTDLWWDLENFVIFWDKDNAFEKEFKKIIN